jgi:AsmA protein
MRMMRVLLIAAGVLVALVLAVIVALYLFVDPNRFRGDIERAAQQHTGRRLEIAGKLELKIFPWLALSVHDVRLGNPPGFGDRPFATVRSASVGVRLLPLLRDRLEVSRIALDGLHVELISRESHNNWSDLTGSGEEKEKPSEPRRSSAGQLSIGGVQVNDASLVMRDEVKKTSSELAIRELHVSRLKADPAGALIEDLRLAALWQTKAAGSAGKPLPLSVRVPRIAIEGDAQRLAPANIELGAGGLSLKVTASGEHVFGERVVSGTISMAKTSPRALLESLDIAPPVTRDPHALAQASLSSHYRLTAHQLQLSDLDLGLDATRVRGKLAIEDLDSLASSFELAVNQINLDSYRAPLKKPPAQSTQGARNAPPAAPTPLPLATLRKLNTHGTLRIGSVTVAGLTLTDVALPLVAKDGHLRLGPTQAHMYGGAYDGDIHVDAGASTAQLSLNEHVHNVDVGALVKAALDSARLSGRGDVSIVASGNGATDQALLRSLSGKVDAVVHQGALLGIDIGYELQAANALLKRQVPPARSGAARTVFNSLEAHGTLDKGVLHNDTLRMETDFLKVHGQGTLDTVTEAIDYRIAASTTAASGRPGNGLDALRGTEVPISVTGTLANPSIRPDLQALAKGQLGKEVKQRAGDLVKKKLGDLFGH